MFELEILREQLGRNASLALRFLFPHWCRLPFSRMHHESLARYDVLAAGEPWPKRKGRRLVLIAPRGHAKSAIHSTLLPLLDLCFCREPFIVLVSATVAQATARLRAIRHELRTNQLLHTLFPDSTKLSECNTRTLVVGQARVSAYGAGCELRGIGHNTARPSKIILDDIEESERVASAAYRESLAAWFHEVIEPLGEPATNIEVVGTLLHRDALLAQLARSAHFEARVYRAVEQWAPELQLWQRWQQIVTNPDLADSVTRGRVFFRAHEKAMLAGTRVLWPEKESYLDLMEQFVALGRPAFYKEKQNLPPAGEDTFFIPENWRYFSLGSNGLIRELANETAENGQCHPLDRDKESNNVGCGAPKQACAGGASADQALYSPGQQGTCTSGEGGPDDSHNLPCGLTSCFGADFENPRKQTTAGSSEDLCAHTCPTPQDGMKPRGDVVVRQSNSEHELDNGKIMSSGNAKRGLAQSPASRALRLCDLIVVGYLDPSLGKGDWAAIATVGKAATTNMLYVLDVWLARVAPAAQIRRIRELHQRWRYHSFGYEAVGFQRILDETFSALRESESGWALPELRLRPIATNERKVARIAALEPLIASGRIRFAAGLPQELFEEARAFPHCKHDDALDALAGAVALARSVRGHQTIRTVVSPSRRARG